MNHDNLTNQPSRSDSPSSRHVGFIGPLFLILGGWFLWGPELLSIPRPEPVMVAGNLIGTQSLRPGPTVPPTISSGSYDLKCMECHRLFTGIRTTPRILTQHRDIRLDHGLNEWCLNCHDREQRDRLILTNGKTVSFGESPQLCGKCHGPAYRDWQKGMHGRTNGSWDASSGRQIRLGCTECHDPHAPAINSMSVLPGPHTLRMGDPPELGGHAVPGKHNPLRRWSGATPHMSQESDLEGEKH